jgi:hypothetical protein
VIRKSSKENIYSVKEAAKELGLTEHAIYKRIERGLVISNKLGDKTIVIPESEILRERQIRNKSITSSETTHLQTRIYSIQQQLIRIQQEVDNLMKKIGATEPHVDHEGKLFFNDIDLIKRDDFEGFISVESLRKGISPYVPTVKGIYQILDLSGQEPIFKKKNKAGRFRGENPTVDVNELKKNWVQNTIVLYIDQAGGGTSSATLNSRIRQLISFGGGKPIAHWGGRYLWQLENAQNLTLCWKLTPKSDPAKLKKDYIRRFVADYGNLPFANLKE